MLKLLWRRLAINYNYDNDEPEPNGNNKSKQQQNDKLRYFDTLDWEYKDANTAYATHQYHTYASKYPPQIPYNLIKIFAEKKDDVILDNFMGSGTTLVESKILGRNAIGVDINPLACLISKVKTTNLQNFELKEISAITESIKQDIMTINHHSGNGKLTLAISELNPLLARWYDQSVIYELLAIKNTIDSLESERIRDFLLVAFSSILRTVSNASKDFGNLMIDKNKHHHDHPKTGIYEKFVFAVNDMIKGMLQFNKMTNCCTNTDCSSGSVKIFKHDTRDLSSINSDESIDFICTHPPYMAAIPYAEYQKLSLWWLFGIDSVNTLDKVLIGGQRSRNDTAERFLYDIQKSLIEMKRIVVKKKYCCITIGNPVYRGKL